MRRLVIILAVVCGLVPACGRGQDPSIDAPEATGPLQTELTVTAKNTAFSPTTLNVPAGKDLTITFRNEDTIPHSFHLSGGSAGDIKTDPKPGPTTEALKATLQVPASYPFQCDVHPAMKGTVLVVREDEDS